MCDCGFGCSHRASSGAVKELDFETRAECLVGQPSESAYWVEFCCIQEDGVIDQTLCPEAVLMMLGTAS